MARGRNTRSGSEWRRALVEDALLTADATVGLAHFPMRLMARLQVMGTVAAIDIDVYTAGLANEQS
jgi:hypothetical protein